jgi:hypothetical protein
MWLLFKLINRRWWVRLDNDVAKLTGRLKKLRWLKQDEEPMESEMVEGR